MILRMGRHKLHYYDGKMVRDQLNEAIDLAAEIHKQEQILIQKLYWIDQKRFFVRYGFKSLTGFCRVALKFSKTQAQRIVTQVRRCEPTDNIVEERTSPRKRTLLIQRKGTRLLDI